MVRQLAAAMLVALTVGGAAYGAETFRDPQQFGDCLVRYGVKIAKTRGVNSEKAASLAWSQCKLLGSLDDFDDGGFEDGIVNEIERRLTKQNAPPEISPSETAEERMSPIFDDAMATCKGANLDDSEDPICGRKEASISNTVAYNYISKMDKISRYEAELYYLMKNTQCTARSIWKYYGGNSGSQKFFLDISQNQCAIEWLRYLRFCAFNNTGYIPSNIDNFHKEYLICFDVSVGASWFTSTGRSPMPYDIDFLRPWYTTRMREVGRPRD